MRPLDHQQSRPPDPPPKPRPDPTPSGTSRKNRHPEHRYASDRTRARNDNQSRNAYLIGAFRLRLPERLVRGTNEGRPAYGSCNQVHQFPRRRVPKGTT
jgi:hypothetical protein